MRQSFEEAIEATVQNSISAVDESCTPKGITKEEPIPPIVRLWKARGLAVFVPNQSNAFMLGNELSNITTGPEELSALLLVLRRIGETASALKAAQNFSEATLNGREITSHSKVKIQIALAIEDAQPEEAERIVRETLEQRKEDFPAAWPPTPMRRAVPPERRGAIPTRAAASRQRSPRPWAATTGAR